MKEAPVPVSVLQTTFHQKRVSNTASGAARFPERKNLSLHHTQTLFQKNLRSSHLIQNLRKEVPRDVSPSSPSFMWRNANRKEIITNKTNFSHIEKPFADHSMTMQNLKR